jgi:hypothetical protein
VSRSRLGPPRSSLGRLLGGALILAMVLAVLPAFAAAAPATPSCESRQAVDYAAPLARMPGAHPLPEGELPFGPRNFSVATLGWSHVALVGSSFGYSFSGKHEPYRVLDLGWRTTATAWAVDPDGRVRRKLGSRQWKVDKVKELSKLQLSFPAERPGFVRVDVRIASLAGRRLGSYRDYFRVLARTEDTAIAIDRGSVHPGEAIVAQVENRGAGHISGRAAPLEVERFAGGAWEVVPQPPTPESVASFGLFLGPGEASRCHAYVVPADAPPGRYRLATTIRVANSGRHRSLTRAFEVIPAGSETGIG